MALIILAIAVLLGVAIYATALMVYAMSVTLAILIVMVFWGGVVVGSVTGVVIFVIATLLLPESMQTTSILISIIIGLIVAVLVLSSVVREVKDLFKKILGKKNGQV